MFVFLLFFDCGVLHPFVLKCSTAAVVLQMIVVVKMLSNSSSYQHETIKPRLLSFLLYQVLFLNSSNCCNVPDICLQSWRKQNLSGILALLEESFLNQSFMMSGTMSLEGIKPLPKFQRQQRGTRNLLVKLLRARI